MHNRVILDYLGQLCGYSLLMNCFSTNVPTICRLILSSHHITTFTHHSSKALVCCSLYRLVWYTNTPLTSTFITSIEIERDSGREKKMSYCSQSGIQSNIYIECVHSLASFWVGSHRVTRNCCNKSPNYGSPCSQSGLDATGRHRILLL